MAGYEIYDIETSGRDFGNDRIMQFGAICTNDDYNQIGPANNFLVKLDVDVVPDPDAILVHGLTPQKVNQEGVSERWLSHYLLREVFTPSTTTIGFNNISFDDRFMHHLFWRNFLPPYKWHSTQNRSRWDLLNGLRLVRALRPEGVNWPVDEDGNPVNKLGALALSNGVELESAHDALEDVLATAGLLKVLKLKQPKMLKFMLNHRYKQAVEKLVSPESPVPFVYTNYGYPKEYERTSVAIVIGRYSNNHNSLIVYDLRQDPHDYQNLSIEDMLAMIDTKSPTSDQILPINRLSVNQCPPVAPLNTLDQDAQKRIGLNMSTIQKHYHALIEAKDFRVKAVEAVNLSQKPFKRKNPEGRLYERIPFTSDIIRAQQVSGAENCMLELEDPEFYDARMKKLYLFYLARNFPQKLSNDQKLAWQKHLNARHRYSIDGSLSFSKFISIVDNRLQNPSIGMHEQSLLIDLREYADSMYTR